MGNLSEEGFKSTLAAGIATAQSPAVCTWQVTAGASVKPLVPIWLTVTAYIVGEAVTIGGAAWRCTTAGSSGATGPTGTTTSVDGTVTWTYVGPVATAFPNGFAAVNTDGTSIVYYGTSPAITTTKGSAALPISGGAITLPASPALLYVVAGANAIVTVTALV